MAGERTIHTNWFDRGGQAYARFRPEYPPALARFLAEAVPVRGRAVDVGCGNGQLTHQLANYFQEVVGLDPSADQLVNATTHQRVRYLCAPAESLPLSDHSVDLVTAAQAAHWFDLPRFYDEVRRISRENALVALISYGVLRLDSTDLNERFDRFYWQEIGPYWPAERRLVDTGYATLPFSFSAIPAPGFSIERSWEPGALLGYISTWSASRRVIEAGRRDILEAFAADLSRLWGKESRKVIWPITIRLGRV